MERIKHSPEAADRLVEIAGKLDAEATVVLAGVCTPKRPTVWRQSCPSWRDLNCVSKTTCQVPIGRQLAEGATPGVDRLLGGGRGLEPRQAGRHCRGCRDRHHG